MVCSVVLTLAYRMVCGWWSLVAFLVMFNPIGDVFVRVLLDEIGVRMALVNPYEHLNYRP